MLKHDAGTWERVRSQQPMGLCGRRGTDEENAAYTAKMQADYDAAMARYRAKGSYGYL